MKSLIKRLEANQRWGLAPKDDNYCPCCFMPATSIGLLGEDLAFTCKDCQLTWFEEHQPLPGWNDRNKGA